MVFKSSREFSVPTQDALSWMLLPERKDDDRAVIFDANDPERHLSRAGYRSLSKKMAAGLHKLGVQKGQCIFVHATNDIYLPVAAFACVALEAIYCPVSTFEPESRITQLFDRSSATWILSDPEQVPLYERVLEAAQLPASRLVVLDFPGREPHSQSYYSYRQLLRHGEREWQSFDDKTRSENEVIMRAFTSGTTGLPKIAQLPHTAWTWMAHARVNVGRPYEIRYLHYLPLFHVTGWYSTAEVLRGSNMRLYISGSPNVTQLVSLCDRLKITDTYITPKSMSEMYQLIENETIPVSALKSIRQFAGVGGPVQPAVVSKLKNVLGKEFHVTSAYGTTETAGITSLPYLMEVPTKQFPLGVTLPGIRMKLVDTDGSPITSFDSPGELYVSTPSMLVDYYNDPAATANAVTHDSDGRWFRTGDVVFLSSETNCWYMVGRADDVFKAGHGEKVAPTEIEELLTSHPSILDAAVGPVPNAAGGNEVKAWVQSKDPNLTQEDVLQFLAGKLADYKMPTAGVQFVDQIPRNATGKIARKSLMTL